MKGILPQTTLLATVSFQPAGTKVATANSPYTNEITGPAGFLRLKSN